MKLKAYSSLIFSFFLFSTFLIAQGDLYWSDVDDGKIKVLDLNDQVDPKVILSQSVVDYHVIDFENENVYWTDMGRLALFKSKLDGTGVKVIIEDLTAPKGISLDENGNLYFIDDKNILITDTTGSNQRVLIGNLSSPRDLVYWNNSIFWSDLVDKKIETIQIDGSGRSTLVSDVSHVIDLEIYKQTQEIYWVQFSGATPGSGVFKADLNGDNKTEIVVGFAKGLGIDEEAGIIYWSETIFNSINRYNISNQTNDRFIGGSLPSPKSISIDKVNNKIYFIDNNYGSFFYEANLSNGSAIKKLIDTQVYRPDRIEIDTRNEKIYWINSKVHFPMITVPI
ncbi:MAG: hypothetical protein R2879_22465 [Saprospiraceae bacterium]